jgi:uncharacterized surface protein with fasciclin (FAS1) repeats
LRTIESATIYEDETMIKLLLFIWLLILAVIGFFLFFLGFTGVSSTTVSPEFDSLEPFVEIVPQSDDSTILGVAVADGRFTTLVTALQETGLDVMLQGEGSYTVFAPTDDAFDALPPGTVDALWEDPGKLSNILLYHIADGNLYAADITGMDEIPTLQGESLIVSQEAGVVYVNQARIVVSDITASNGVIHVIDAALIPDTE